MRLHVWKTLSVRTSNMWGRKKLISIPPEQIGINSLKEHPSPFTKRTYDVGILSIPEEKRC